MMVKEFCSYIADNQLLNQSQKTLLAVSGGVDSVTMCYLFQKADFLFGIAHCNFKLRGEASNEDEIFVKKLANQLHVPFFSIAFDTEKIAQENRQSIQVTARELRYDWLEEIRAENEFSHIATAHHLNDSIETLFYNFTKGCGIRGLHGILPQVEKIIRPISFATKEDIEFFAKKEGISWREDTSNATDKYARNKIRHHVIPLLKQLNPAFEKTAGENILRLRETEALYDFAIQKLKENIVEKTVDAIKISINNLCASPAPSSVLFEILKPYNYNNNQVQQILQAINNQPGKTFFSKKYCLLIDRDFLILKKIEAKDNDSIIIHQDSMKIQLPDGFLTMKKLNEKPAQFPKSNFQALLDFDKLSFPLTLRKWQPGDCFCPLGMNGQHQKLQDFFSNNKLTRFEKENVWLLDNQGEICWIVGYRLDERYKVRVKTKNCLFFAIES